MYSFSSARYCSHSDKAACANSAEYPRDFLLDSRAPRLLDYQDVYAQRVRAQGMLEDEAQVVAVLLKLHHDGVAECRVPRYVVRFAFLFLGLVVCVHSLEYSPFPQGGIEGGGSTSPPAAVFRLKYPPLDILAKCAYPYTY